MSRLLDDADALTSEVIARAVLYESLSKGIALFTEAAIFVVVWRALRQSLSMSLCKRKNATA